MNEKKDDIDRVILDYLRKNIEAGDTLEEISKWWLNLVKIEITVNEVSSDLETLIKECKVKRQVINGGNLIYKICKELSLT